MSPVSLVFHIIVTWDWSQICYLNKDTCSILLDIHVFTPKRPRTLFSFKPLGTNKISCHIFSSRFLLSDLVLNSFSNKFKTGRDLFQVCLTVLNQKLSFMILFRNLTLHGNLKAPSLISPTFQFLEKTRTIVFLRATTLPNRQITFDFGQLKVAPNSETDSSLNYLLFNFNNFLTLKKFECDFGCN